MNILNLGRGNFFGIIIPGFFLLCNFLLISPQVVSDLYDVESLKPLLNNNAVVFPFLLILSYIIGFSLRLFKPTYVEKLSIVLWAPYCLLKPIWLKLLKKKKIRVKDSIKLHFKRFWESFPYIDWFIDSYLSETPETYQKFFQDNLLKGEFKNDRELLRGYSFINYCKLYVYSKSTVLRDEISFSEGLVRFLSGMCYALFVSIIFVAYFFEYKTKTISIAYLVLLILFTTKLRQIRTKEVATIIDSYYFTYENSLETKGR